MNREKITVIINEKSWLSTEDIPEVVGNRVDVIEPAAALKAFIMMLARMGRV